MPEPRPVYMPGALVIFLIAAAFALFALGIDALVNLVVDLSACFAE